MKVSNCCGASIIENTDLCSQCKEHSDVVEVETIRKTSRRLYKILQGMKTRCYNENRLSYSRYGGRGISICNEWKDSYERFELWALSSGHKENLTIDRIDNDGNYEPSNCRWVSRSTQSRNTKRIRKDNKSGYRGVIEAKNGFRK